MSSMLRSAAVVEVSAKHWLARQAGKLASGARALQQIQDTYRPAWEVLPDELKHRVGSGELDVLQAMDLLLVAKAQGSNSWVSGPPKAPKAKLFVVFLTIFGDRSF